MFEYAMIFNWFKKKKKPKVESNKKFNHKVRKNSEKMTDKEKMDEGFNGKTYSINGIDYDFQKDVTMKFFIVAIMTLIHADGGRDFFVFDKTFDTQAECKQFARQNMRGISSKIIQEFGTKDRPSMISCVEEKVVNKIFTLGYNKDSSSIQWLTNTTCQCILNLQNKE